MSLAAPLCLKVSQSKRRNIKNGRAGFDGVTDGGLSVWGYDEDVASVVHSNK
jgi:hypothetical protein